MNFAFARKSRNAKTGDIPVTTSDAKTCPDACPLKASGACYAKHGPLGMYWKKINAGQYANNLSEADSLKALNIGPVVTVLPREAPQDRYTRLALERMGAW